MKTLVKWICISIGLLVLVLLGGWLASPLIVRHYINNHIKGVQVASARLKSLDCVQLGGVHINVANTSGDLKHVVACRKKKTVDIDGGALDVTINEDESSKKPPSGYKFTARNLEITLRVKGKIILINGATLDPGKVCGRHAQVKLGVVGQVQVDDVCVDTKTHLITFDKGSAFLTQIFGHKVGNVTFGKGVVDPKTKIVDLDLLVRDPFTVRGLHVELKDKLATIKAASLVGEHKRIFKSPLTLKDIEVGPINIDHPLEGVFHVSSKGASLLLDLSNEHWNVSGGETCQKWLDAVPDELKTGPISEMQLQGKFSIDLTIKPDVKLKMSNQCALAKGAIPKFIKALDGRFKYTVYHPDGSTYERETGPNSADWVPLQMISPNMATALTTTEDPGFPYHRGIIPQAVENSLRDNLKLGKFFRGGSTLTMQLAKNLWLNRTRTLGRKLQEAILTVALESALPKDRILELYLNVVEYGPNLYGIGPASKELLGKDPEELSLTDAMYLVLRLPAPNHSAPYEKMKGMIGKLLDNVAASGKVSPELIEVEKSLLKAPVVEDDDD